MNSFTIPLDIHDRMLTHGADTIETMRVLPERLDDLASVQVGQTPREVIYSENKLDLQPDSLIDLLSTNHE